MTIIFRGRDSDCDGKRIGYWIEALLFLFVTEPVFPDSLNHGKQ